MAKQTISIKKLKQTAHIASKAIGLDLYVEGTGSRRYICATRRNGLKGYIGCIGTADELYEQLVAIISVVEMKTGTIVDLG